MNSVACNYYLLQDLLYRAVALTNSSGQIVEAYDCEAYGNTLIFTGHGPDGLWFTDDDVQSRYGANEIIFCGYRFDPEAQLYYVRNRTYNPALGRWIQRDPIGYDGGINLYGYVESSPVGNVDASGFWIITPTGIATAQPGDNLGGLAQLVYGRASAWPLLGYGGDPRLLQAGSQINISDSPALNNLKKFSVAFANSRKWLGAARRSGCPWSEPKDKGNNNLAEAGLNLASLMDSAAQAARQAAKLGKESGSLVGQGIGIGATVVDAATAVNAFGAGDGDTAISYGASTVGDVAGFFVPAIGVANALGSAGRLIIDSYYGSKAQSAATAADRCGCEFYRREHDFYSRQAHRLYKSIRPLLGALKNGRK